jgi:hypothetical protein
MLLRCWQHLTQSVTCVSPRPVRSGSHARCETSAACVMSALRAPVRVSSTELLFQQYHYYMCLREKTCFVTRIRPFSVAPTRQLASFCQFLPVATKKGSCMATERYSQPLINFCSVLIPKLVNKTLKSPSPLYAHEAMRPDLGEFSKADPKRLRPMKFGLFANSGTC